MDGQGYLVDNDGCMMSYENVCLKYDLTVSRGSFAPEMRAVPGPTVGLIKGIVSDSIHALALVFHISWLVDTTLKAFKFLTKQLEKCLMTSHTLYGHFEILLNKSFPKILYFLCTLNI